jgi:hypothetical protein
MDKTTLSMSDDGIFGKSFKREVGKNTGKLVSNFLFGDKWSTPHKVISERAKIQGENDKIRIESNEKRKDKDQLNLIDAAVLSNIDKVATFRYSADKTELIEQLSELSVQLSANKYHNTGDEEAKIRNKFNDALLEKYKQGLIRLKAIDPNEPLLPYYKKAYRKARFIKSWKRFYVLYILLFLFIGFLLLVGFFDIMGW